VTMTRVISVGFGVVCMITMGMVGYAAQAKPATRGGASAGSAAAKALKNPVAADAVSVDTGKGIFSKRCAACHGLQGKGDGPGAAMMKEVKPANLADAKWDHGGSDGEIFTTIKNGVGPKFDMDAWDGRIPDKDIWNLVNYIKTLSAPAR
jgi:mono/diheme cytochrome c family protein